MLALFRLSRLVYAPGHVQADEGEEEVDNEHLKRYISTRRSVDPVFTLPLPTYFRNQVNHLLCIVFCFCFLRIIYVVPLSAN